MNQFLLIVLSSILVAAVWFDIRFRRIPNALVFPGIVLGLGLSIFFEGTAGFIPHVGGMLVLGALWFGFWQAGIMGGGDQKLMMMVGAFVGFKLALPVALLVAVSGGLQALLAIVWRRYVRRDQQFDWKKIVLPYSLAIALGTWGAILLERCTPFY